MSKILSVSVAAYNVQNFIRENIESFIGTEVSKKIEVLIVDDGSTDDTANIVKYYEEKYPETVKYIYQKNAGPGATVNTGLANATGRYFRMVDGDDWVDKKNLKTFIEFLENNDVDVVYTSYTLVDNNTYKEVPEKLIFDRYNEVLAYDSVCEKLTVSMHNVTYKTAILKENGFKMDNCFYTDMEYLLFPIKNLNTVAVLDLNLYMYRVSLACQSMNLNSMIKNKNMHLKVFQTVFQDFLRFQDQMTEPKVLVIRKRLLIMAGAQLSIYLGQKNVKLSKKEIKEFASNLYSDVELYKQFLNLKTMKLLSCSKYLLLPICMRLHQKKHRVK